MPGALTEPLVQDARLLRLQGARRIAPQVHVPVPVLAEVHPSLSSNGRCSCPVLTCARRLRNGPSSHESHRKSIKKTMKNHENHRKHPKNPSKRPPSLSSGRRLKAFSSAWLLRTSSRPKRSRLTRTRSPRAYLSRPPRAESPGSHAMFHVLKRKCSHNSNHNHHIHAYYIVVYTIFVFILFTFVYD